MKKQKFYRCACYLSSDIPVPELDMKINYVGRHAFVRQFGEALNRYGYTSQEQQEAIIKRVETTVFSRMNDVKEAQHSREQDDLNMCYIPFDEEVYKFKESCLDPEFVEVAKTVDSPESLPPSWIISKEKEVYRIPLFTREFAEKLLYELDHFESSEMPKIRPNVINNYATVLSEVGFDEQFVTPLRDQYLSPLVRALFPHWTGARFDSHNAFTVRGEPGKDSGLEFHYDNAEVTLNVCLGRRGFSGGELYFSDMREEPLDQCSSTLLQRQLPCHAFLHRGQQLRGALSTLSGEHVNLVVWLRSSEMRNRRCPLCDHVPTLVAAGEGYGDGFTARSPSQESAVLKFPKFPLHRLTSSSERMQPIDAQAQ
ncbi:LOW QUALITY PROTEIN: 2-oxoglutarate and iron-dependent oxygenase domain-containing protein 2 [Rhipicephalus sanguineus]|uniref:LOW QUALITY PROTEIN: 2-oxoglutarate and iron-dependent oxygenase domain-containing protein 2 n=1 Tax=Rhipicephalus sanguineus TaxID=34632 RepID=UPI0020C20C67|nr:LOW QUALITY PROTEIN: 2-oxoglutarate and iron-dependent oxygenase domain-containing protein 2 [Rhipicephalus sanguineus]